MLAGTGFRVPPDLQRWRPLRRMLRALLSLCRAVVRLTGIRPAMPVDAAAARGLEQQLLETVVESLSAARPDPDPPATQREAALLGRLEDLLHAPFNHRAGAGALFAALGTSEAPLCAYCRVHLGVGPRLYVNLRRAIIVQQSSVL
jgi:hypothetical protein